MPPDRRSVPSPWRDAPLDELCRHLVDHHHARTRHLLTRARLILSEMVLAYPGRTELTELGRVLTVLEQDLSRHMVVEELVLFPYVERLCAAEAGEAHVVTPAGESDGPVRVAQHDHENAHSLLRGIAELAARLRAKDPDEELGRLLAALAALEEDLEAHSALEDDVLFPRLRALEERIARGARPRRATNPT
jgi:regulator of cell morphogenesis and NO signaling